MSSRRLSPLFTWRGAVVRSDLDGTAKHVALTLSLYMSELGDSAFPKQSTLVADCSRSRSTVIAALNRLEADGWLAVDHAGKNGRANTYRARIPKGVRLPDTPDEEGPDHRTPGVQPPDGGVRESDITPITTSSTTSKKAKHPRDEAFEVLCEVGELTDYREITPKVRDQVNTALADIRAQWTPIDISRRPDGELADQIRVRAGYYRSHFSGATISALALAKYWPRLARPAPGPDGGVDVDEVRRRFGVAT